MINTEDLKFRIDNPHRPLPCSWRTYCLPGVGHQTEVYDEQTKATTQQDDFKAALHRPQLCKAGTYCESTASTPSGTADCPVAHYCEDGIGKPQPTPRGHFTKSTGAKNPQRCAVGLYQPNEASIHCYWCPAGYDCQNEATLYPTPCGLGHYREFIEGTSSPCAPCKEGSYFAETRNINADFCLSCPIGRVCQ